MKLNFACFRLCVIFLFAAAVSAQTVPTPKDVLGFTPGDDRKLASWAQVVEYFKKLDAASDRVQFHEIGKSTMGKPFVYAIISSPENIKNLEKYKMQNAQLADPRTYILKAQPPPEQTARRIIADSKTIVLKTFGVHSTEVGSYLSSMLIAHELASSNEPRIKKILDETITLIVPALSPDGVDIVKDWYDKTLGTPYEGTSPPELYHKYVGHDLNRDWYAFTQVETQLTVEHIHNVWRPQIVHDVHQQGSHGARFFVPPYMDPVEPNVPKEIVEGYTELGLYVAKDMRGKGFQGLTTGTTYDAWTPARAYSHYHGGVRILSETASARLATPITVKAEDLRGGRGVDPHKDDANNGPAWKGGEWKLRDITNYMTTAAFSILDHAAANRTKWLTRFYDISREAVRPRKDGEPTAYLIDAGSWRNDTNAYAFVQILKRGGVEVEFGNRLKIDNVIRQGTFFTIKAAQPYYNFAKALIEGQKYPDLLDASKNPIPPYDVTAHSLALLQNINVQFVTLPFELTYESVRGDSASKTHYREKSVRVYQSYIPSMDKGWTMWGLESVRNYSDKHNYPPQTITNREFEDISEATKSMERSGNGLINTIVFPDQSPNQILNGYPKGSMPDEYVGGVGKEGVENLKKFVEAGGTLVFLNESSRFAIEQFNLPITDVTRGIARKDFYIPGSILRTNLDTSHPIAKGMPKDSIAWFEDSPVFELKENSLCSEKNTATAVVNSQAKNSPPYQGGVAEQSEDGVVLSYGPADTDKNHPTAKAAPLLGKEGSSCVRVIAKYPEKSADILLSGWALGQEKIAGKAALVEVTYGKGKIILFGFRPQYRGQSLATFPLLFNAISQ